MIVTTITAVLQIDVRNPFDKLVIQTFGVSSSPARMKSCLSLKTNEVWDEVKQIQKTGLLTISVWGEDTHEIHKLAALPGKQISEVTLLAKQVEVLPSIPIVDVGLPEISFHFVLAISCWQ